jgi:transaldolase
MRLVEDLTVKIFADGADEKSMLQMYNTPFIKGLTTNPTLMRQAGVEDYRKFCRGILETITDKPISFEVFSDDFDEMKKQALEIASWANNVYVKVPVTNTKGETSAPLVKWLSDQAVKVNVTAVFTDRQIEEFSEVLSAEVPSYLSVFAGRIADTGVDPVPVIKKAVDSLAHLIECEVIWASPRELLNVFQADAVGCQVITVTSDILKKLPLTGKDLNKFSLETVQMFYDDASAAGYSL